MEASRDELPVEGRSCGTCTVCCYALPFDTPEFQKLPGAVCQNCTGVAVGSTKRAQPLAVNFIAAGGCCLGWTRSGGPIDAASWSRLSLMRSSPNSTCERAFEFLLVGGEAAVRRRAFLDFLCLCIRRRVAIFVSRPWPEGFSREGRLADAAGRNDNAGILLLMLTLLEQAKDHKFQKVAPNNQAPAAESHT